MVMLLRSKGSGHWEKATCIAQTCLSLDVGVSLEGSQDLIAPMYVKADSTLDWVLKLYPYLLEWFCLVFYNIMHLLFLFRRQYFPASFVSCYLVYFQFIFYSHTFEWKHQTRNLGKEGQVCHFRMLWEVQTHSRCSLRGRQSWWCGKGWGGGGTHSGYWCSIDHLVEQDPLSKNRLE